MPLVLLNGKMAESWQEPLARLAGADFEFRPMVDGLSEPRLFRDADVLVSPNFDRSMPAMGALRLLQVPLIGTDQVFLDELWPQVTVANVTGHATAVAEYVLMAMLISARNAIEIAGAFRGGSWEHSSRMSGPPSAELEGRTVAVVGFGHIGRAVARRSAAMGMTVTVCNRTPIKAADVSAYYQLDALRECLAGADYIVVAIDLAANTRGLIGEAELRALQKSAVIINVARGECVDEAALYAACSAGRIGGAVIDTWYQYPSATDRSPRPSRFGFDLLPNVIMTPHVSAWTEGTIERRQAQIVTNLQNLRDGLPLDRVVANGQAATKWSAMQC